MVYNKLSLQLKLIKWYVRKWWNGTSVCCVVLISFKQTSRNVVLRAHFLCIVLLSYDTVIYVFLILKNARWVLCTKVYTDTSIIVVQWRRVYVWNVSWKPEEFSFGELLQPWSFRICLTKALEFFMTNFARQLEFLVTSFLHFLANVLSLQWEG